MKSHSWFFFSFGQRISIQIDPFQTLFWGNSNRSFPFWNALHDWKFSFFFTLIAYLPRRKTFIQPNNHQIRSSVLSIIFSSHEANISDWSRSSIIYYRQYRQKNEFWYGSYKKRLKDVWNWIDALHCKYKYLNILESLTNKGKIWEWKMKIMTVCIVIGKYLSPCVIYFNSSTNVRGYRGGLGAQNISIKDLHITENFIQVSCSKRVRAKIFWKFHN